MIPTLATAFRRVIPGRRTAAALLAFAGALGLAACGSGGGSGGTTLPPAGALFVNVTDSLGAPVPRAAVNATLGSFAVGGDTTSRGRVELAIQWPAGTAQITVAAQSFQSQTVSAAITPGIVNTVNVTLQKARAPGGASVDPGTPTRYGNGTMTFDIDLIIVDADGQPINGLTASAFRLQPCTPVASTSDADCIQGASASFDAPYTVPSPTPDALAVIPGATPNPQAIGLLLDQSTSVGNTDPSAARLFAAKQFLQTLRPGDSVLLGAFATDAEARIPTTPLTLYAPIRSASQITAAPSYLDTIDELAQLIGGNTPMYDALVATVGQMAASGGSLPKSIVFVTDGKDTVCEGAGNCPQRETDTISAANAAGVRLFPVGLSRDANIGALGALASGTGGLLLFADEPAQLVALFAAANNMVAAGASRYRLTYTVASGTAGAFVPGNRLFGTIEVTAGGATFNVAFAYTMR